MDLEQVAPSLQKHPFCGIITNIRLLFSFFYLVENQLADYYVFNKTCS